MHVQNMRHGGRDFFASRWRVLRAVRNSQNDAAGSQIASGDWAILGACVALAVVVGLFIFYIQPDASDLAPHRTKLDQLLERRDTIYDNLRDLRFEYRSGKYSEGDFEAMKTALENEA